MVNTYTHLFYHFTWSVKNRTRTILPEIEKDVWALIAQAGLAMKKPADRILPVKIGGIETHVHVAAYVPKTVSVSDAVKRLKGGSSSAINAAGLVPGHFKWQDGYAGFSVSQSQKKALVRYVDRQREHHQRIGFEEEYRKLLEAHSIEFDEKYLLG